MENINHAINIYDIPIQAINVKIVRERERDLVRNTERTIIPDRCVSNLILGELNTENTENILHIRRGSIYTFLNLDSDDRWAIVGVILFGIIVVILYVTN